MQSLGVKVTWDGHHLNLTPPAGWNVDASGAPQPKRVSADTMDFVTGGSQFEVAPKLVALDPASGVMTTYVPIYYVNQFLNRRFLMKTSWNGSTWTMTTQHSRLTASAIQSIMTSTVEVKDATEHFMADHSKTSVPDGRGGTVTAVVGTRFPTADGLGQLVFFWHNGTYLGTSAATEAVNILSVKADGTGRFVVTYANYKSTDPMVSPSLPPQTVTYTYNGHAMTASGALNPGVMNGIQVKY